MTLPAAVVDTGALLKVIAASLVAGVGVTVAFSIALAGAIRFVDLRRDGRPVEAGVLALVAFVGLAVSVAAVAAGILVMTQKD